MEHIGLGEGGVTWNSGRRRRPWLLEDHERRTGRAAWPDLILEFAGPKIWWKLERGKKWRPAKRTNGFKNKVQYTDRILFTLLLIHAEEFQTDKKKYKCTTRPLVIVSFVLPMVTYLHLDTKPKIMNDLSQ